MKKIVRFFIALAVFFALAYLIIFFPIPSIIGIAIVFTALGLYDLLQTKHTILRNFPIIGHFRYLLEGIGPEIRQYFIESDTDGKPLNRNQRTYIYSRAKKQISTHPFGTENDVNKDGYEWTSHSVFPAPLMAEPPRVLIGGKACKQPYSASLMNVSAMSYGSMSKNAIMALNKGAKAGGFYHNTGEGSISEYHRMGGDIVYQVGTGYFGCRDLEGNFSPEHFKESAGLEVVKMIEIKLSQGAKPGHGGILPAAKNTEEIAKIRGIKPFTDVHSPPAHKAFNSPEGLLKFVEQLRDLSNGKPVGFKICIGDTKEFEAICEAIKSTGIKPDFITVDGSEGGTGAAPIVFSDHVGMPWENALVFVVKTLKQFQLKDEIKVITSGKIVDGFDIFKALCLGADLCNCARAMMLAIGCIQALECHKNTCPTGVATTNPNLYRGLVVEDKWKRVQNYQESTVNDFMEVFSAAGCRELADLNSRKIFKQVNGKPVPFSEIYPELIAYDKEVALS
jgi:glutamate synthase domain-containing protein 2